MNTHSTLRVCAALCLLASMQSAGAQDAEPLPSWPRQFSVQGPEVASFGFALTQPGPIVVDLQVNGAPVLASLEGPAQLVAQRQGNGTLRLSHVATPQEMQKSPVWIVRVKLAGSASQSARNVASGSLNVQHPPADQSRVQAATRNFKAQAASRQAQLDTAAAQQMAQLEMRIDAELRKQNAELEQQNVRRRSALTAQLQPAIERLRAGSIARPDPRVTTRAVAPSGSATRQSATAISSVDRAAILREAPVSSSQPITATAPGGNIQNVAPGPAIASLSAATGRPGDPVLITGSGFGNAIGEVHFVLGPVNDIRVPGAPSQAVPGLLWSDSQIFITVPNVSGMSAFNGTVYVTRTSDQTRSNLMPFAFVPLMERRQIVKPVPADALLAVTGVRPYYLPSSADPDWINRFNMNCFSGSTSNDRFFSNTRLQNGWRVSGPPVVHHPSNYSINGGAYVADSRIGTDWPYVDVKWWVNVGPWCDSMLSYAFVIPIEGPLNTPDGVVVR
jgi:hypothetical protein